MAVSLSVNVLYTVLQLKYTVTKIAVKLTLAIFYFQLTVLFVIKVATTSNVLLVLNTCTAKEGSRTPQDATTTKHRRTSVNSSSKV